VLRATNGFLKLIAAVALTGVAAVLVLRMADVGELIRWLSGIDIAVALAIVLLFVASTFVSAWRLHRSLNFLGSPVSFDVSFRAAVAGQVASLFVLGILGAVAGRQMVLRRVGISVGAGALTVATDRLVVALVSGSLCIGAAALLYADDIVAQLAGRFSIIPLALICLIVGLWQFHSARSHFERRLAAAVAAPRSAMRAVEMLFLAVVGQGLSVAAYVFAAISMGVDAEVAGLVLAGAVISFVASLPISVNGWGVRELAAVSAFGALGVATEPAVASSVLVGLCATAAVLLLAPMLVVRLTGRETANPIYGNSKGFDFDVVFAYVVAIATCVFVFFQTHAFVFDGYISVNLADPIALLALGTTVLSAATLRRRPVWLSPSMFAWLGATTVVLLIGFAVGVGKFGITSWALSNRVLGWFVILGYFCAGAAVAGALGYRGVRRVLETIVLVATAVVLIYSVQRVAALYGILQAPISFDFVGYSTNRNAFAFKLLIAASAVLAVSVAAPWRPRRWIDARVIALGIIIFGIWQTRSLAGTITGTVLLLFIGVIDDERRNLVMRGIVWAFGALFLYEFAGRVGYFFTTGSSFGDFPSAPPMFRPTSLAERFVSIREGIEIWLSNPFFGAGLGGFYERQLTATGSQLVIHSTPVWLLAEFGLIGTLIIAVYPALNVVDWIRGTHRDRSARGVFLVGILLVFLLFGIAHEISYQRIFWLALGAAVGVAAREARDPGPRLT
jgi:hypothetical protein